MPPFAGTMVLASSAPDCKMGGGGSEIVSINVGGQVFQTTRDTLSLAGPHSPLASLPAFLDRDPLLFSPLLSLLRSGRLPSSLTVHPDDLSAEARFYGLDRLLSAAISASDRFDPFSLRRTLSLPLPGRDAPSALAGAPTSAVLHVAHGGKVTTFDPTLRRRSTALSPLPAIDSLLPLSDSCAAVGATDFPGLHVLDLARRGAVRATLAWSPHPSSAGSTVQAVAASPDLLFTSFESCRRNASAIMAFDASTLAPVIEIGRGEIFGAELDSAIPATKLKWVSGFNLLMASGSHAGPSGLLGNIRLWDVRSNHAVFELTERTDCFADVTVSDSDNLSAMFKVGVHSGEIFMADLRKLSQEEPWFCLGDGRKALNGKKEGSGCRLESYGNHVFCSKGGNVELWSEVAMGATRSTEDGLGSGKVMRKNLMGRAKDAGGNRITQLAFGGNRMIITRKDEQCVEVWESSMRS